MVRGRLPKGQLTQGGRRVLSVGDYGLAGEPMEDHGSRDRWTTSGKVAGMITLIRVTTAFCAGLGSLGSTNMDHKDLLQCRVQ